MTTNKNNAPEENSEAINNDMSSIPHSDDELLDWKDESLIPDPDDDAETRVTKSLERLNRADSANALKELMAVQKEEREKAEADTMIGVKGEKTTWFATPIGIEGFESQMDSYPHFDGDEDSAHPFRLLWDAVAPYTRSDRNAFMVGLMTCCGMYLSGRIKFSDIVDPHMFSVLVGTSSKGAKGTTTDKVLDVMEDVLPGFDKKYVEGLISTQEGLLGALQPPYISDPNLPELPIEKEITRKLIVLPELSVLSVVGQRQGNALNQSMRMAYDRSKQTTRVKRLKDSLKIEKNAYVAGSLTNITPAELRIMVTDTEARNGSSNRYYMTWSARSKDLYIPKPWNKDKDVKYWEAVALLQKTLACAVKYHPMWMIAEEDMEYFVHFSKQFDDLDDSFIDSLQLRKQLFYIKIATILGATDIWSHENCNDELMKDVVRDVSYIPFNDLEESGMWIREYENTIKHVFNNQKMSDLAQRILNILSADDNKGMEMSKLHGNLGKNHKVVFVNDAINQLVKLKYARRMTMNNGKVGRDAIYVELIAQPGERKSGG